MAPKCRKMAPRSFQEPSWPLLVALGPLLGRSWPLLAALGSLLVRLEPLPADLGASWGDLGAVLKTLGAMRVKFIDFMTPSSSGLMVSPLENPACSGAILGAQEGLKPLEVGGTWLQPRPP